MATSDPTSFPVIYQCPVCGDWSCLPSVCSGGFDEPEHPSSVQMERIDQAALAHGEQEK